MTAVRYFLDIFVPACKEKAEYFTDICSLADHLNLHTPMMLKYTDVEQTLQ